MVMLMYIEKKAFQESCFGHTSEWQSDIQLEIFDKLLCALSLWEEKFNYIK